MKNVYISEHQIRQFKIDALIGSPMEICGLIIGSENESGFNVVEIKLVENIKPSPSYFEMDSIEVLEVNKYAISRDMSVIGVIHSHPMWPAIPSATDMRFMDNNRGIWIIMSLIDDEVNTFIMNQDNSITKLPM